MEGTPESLYRAGTSPHLLVSFGDRPETVVIALGPHQPGALDRPQLQTFGVLVNTTDQNRYAVAHIEELFKFYALRAAGISLPVPTGAVSTCTIDPSTVQAMAFVMVDVRLLSLVQDKLNTPLDSYLCHAPEHMATLKDAVDEAAEELTQNGIPLDGSRANFMALINACFHQSGALEGKRIAGVVGLTLAPLEDADQAVVIQQIESAAARFCEAAGMSQATAAQATADQAEAAAAAARLAAPSVTVSTSESVKYAFRIYVTDHLAPTMNALGVTGNPIKVIPGLMAMGSIPIKAKGDHSHYDTVTSLLEKSIRSVLATNITDGTVESKKFAFLLDGKNLREVSRSMVSHHLFVGIASDPNTGSEGLASAPCMSMAKMAHVFQKSKGILPQSKDAFEELLPLYSDVAECTDMKAALKAALVVYGSLCIFFGEASAVARHCLTTVATLSACMIRQRFDPEFCKIQAKPTGPDAGCSLLTMLVRQSDRRIFDSVTGAAMAIGERNGAFNFVVPDLQTGEVDITAMVGHWLKETTQSASDSCIKGTKGKQHLRDVELNTLGSDKLAFTRDWIEDPVCHSTGGKYTERYVSSPRYGGKWMAWKEKLTEEERKIYGENPCFHFHAGGICLGCDQDGVERDHCTSARMPCKMLSRLSNFQLSLKSELGKRGNRYQKDKGSKAKDDGAKGETA